MIIEIKDLPHGSKVTRILVDVTFDNESPQSVSLMGSDHITPSITSNKEPERQEHPPAPVEILVSEVPEVPEIKRDPALGPGIPAEMLTTEF